MKRIYLDYASLTPIDKMVSREIKKFSGKEFGNSSALYASAVKARRAIDSAKMRIANVLHGHPDEIIFTSGGTESNHLVIRNKINKQIIISAIEHSSIIKSTEAVHIPVDKCGLVDLDFLKKSITPETTLVSVMMVNNEIGTIENIQDIAKIVRDAKKNFGGQFPLLHTDACQAFIHLPIYVEKLGADIITLDGHKIYGPRGMGMIYIKREAIDILKIDHLGTENLPGIMGFALAIELAEKNRHRETVRVEKLRRFFVDSLKKINSEIKINGDLEKSTPHILNVFIPHIDNEFFILQLDAKGIECSTKSACLQDDDESYVLKAIGADSKESVRFSFGKYTSKNDLEKTLKVIEKILAKKV